MTEADILELIAFAILFLLCITVVIIVFKVAPRIKHISLNGNGFEIDCFKNADK